MPVTSYERIDESIEESFQQLRSFILKDLDLIISQPSGGNYSAVLIVMTGCEVLGRLRYGRSDGGREFFKEYVLPDHWKGVSVDLWEALRNGLVHGYATKNILQVEDKPVEVVISWMNERHLSYNDEQRSLFINVKTLFDAFRQAFDRYEDDLKSNTDYRKKYMTRIKKGLAVHVHESRLPIWKHLLLLSRT
jgi:hypothetical protein